MIRNFILVAFRSLTRQLSYSLINIVGLSIGIACSLVIFLFVYGEWSYDRGFANSERIYKVGVSFFNIGNFGNGPERLFNDLPAEFEGIEAATRILKERNLVLRIDGQDFREPFAYFTDSSFFKVFQHEFVAGDMTTVLAAPNEVVVTESTAMKYFGTTDVLGKTMDVGGDHKPFHVTGVVKDITFNATVNSKMWLSNHEKLTNDRNWSAASFYNFLLLKNNFGSDDVQAALDRVVENHVYPETAAWVGAKTIEEFRAHPNSVKFHLLGMRDIYLRSKLNHEISVGGNESNIYIFSAISIFILTLAAVNFINLTTARASRRAKEVGIRKTMGTSRSRLVFQFLTESVSISLIAMVLSLVLAEVFLLAFEYVTGSPLLTTIWSNPLTVVLFFGFSILVGICSGLYPAFYLTSFNPVRVLKGNITAAGGLTFRNVLVVFQFAVSMVLIVCAFVVQQQLFFVQSKDLGFDANNILTIDKGYLLDRTKAESYKNELDAQTGVVKSSFHAGEPGSKRFMSFYTYQTAGMESPLTINTYLGDAQYVNLMGMKLLSGREFTKDLESDTSSIIVNEATVNALGITGDPIGTVVNKTDKIVGVVGDFHWESLHTSIAPVVFRMTNRQNGEIGFKLEPTHVKAFLATAEAKWKVLVPEEPFTYHFVDDNFKDLLKKDEVFGKAINFFTLLAIFISCLGLYGLSAFTAEQRTKEIGIRKVLGASSAQIVLMLNRKFTVLVVIAIVISIPLATWLISQWLDDFAYKITLGAGVFIFSVLIALFVAWATVSFHSVKASWVNPSEALKYE